MIDKIPVNMFGYLFSGILIFCFVNHISASEYDSFHDVKSFGTGTADVASPSISNPAGISFLESGALSMYCENKFGIKELSRISATGSFFAGFSDIGLGVTRFGYDYYNETTIGINVARKLSSSFSLGVRLNYVMVDIADLESVRSSYFADVGMLWKPTENMTIGMASVIPVSETGGLRKSPSFILKTGFTYFLLSGFSIRFEHDKFFSGNSMIKFGAEYSPMKDLFFRTGMFGKPFTPTFGIGYCLKKTVFDLALQYHSVLGFCSVAGFSYLFNSGK